ncbi:hypothetical protein ACFL3G_04200 [Planctomycetota bacterium]
MKNLEWRQGFTLVETILASAILCGAVLAVGSISTRTLSSTRLNRHYERATALAEKQFRLIDYIGVEDFIQAGEMAGVFEEFEPEYLWEVETEFLDIDNLYMVTVTVSWLEYNRRYSVIAETRLNGVGKLIELEQEE